MNILWLYVISFVMVVLVLSTGYFVGYRSINLLKTHSNSSTLAEITGFELSQKLIVKNRLLNINITNLNARKTNYYSLKYNVIKASPEINNSSSLSALALSANLANNARLGQKKTILYCLNLICSLISKLCSILFIPSVLICAIINVSISSSVPSLIILIALISYTLSFVVQLLILTSNLISTRRLIKDLYSLRIFSKDEMKTLSSLCYAICKINFYDHTKTTLVFFSLTSPNFISSDDVYN